MMIQMITLKSKIDDLVEKYGFGTEKYLESYIIEFYL